jgi:hypothetical protein
MHHRTMHSGRFVVRQVREQMMCETRIEEQHLAGAEVP